MSEYISAPEAAEKWGISERRVQKLCEENRIPGVAKFSSMWLIPKDAFAAYIFAWIFPTVLLVVSYLFWQLLVWLNQDTALNCLTGSGIPHTL